MHDFEDFNNRDVEVGRLRAAKNVGFRGKVFKELGCREGADTGYSFVRPSAARTAAAEPPGMGSRRVSQSYTR